MDIGEIWRRIAWWLIYTGPRRDITIDTFNGRLTIDSKQWLIGKYLYVKRQHEEHEIQAVLKLLREKGFLGPDGATGMLLNVGANIGMTTIALMKNGCAARALAIEPAPENFRLLVKNIEQNGMSARIKPYRLAMSSRDGELEFELSPDNSGDHRIRQTTIPGAYREQERRVITVPATTLDQFMESLPAEDRDISLIWADIQGHEGHFFRGARRTLARGIPTVSEFWPYGIERSGISRQDYCNILADLFQSFHEIDGPATARPIHELAGLFDVYTSPRQFCTLVLVPK